MNILFMSKKKLTELIEAVAFKFWYEHIIKRVNHLESCQKDNENNFGDTVNTINYLKSEEFIGELVSRINKLQLKGKR